ncbi:MAG: wax ester/triacylglycerol synthase family O-acyltransferase [Oleiphilaceae bacterium]|nr:wax ester/triacylglycerol synthase family O-acyltransferase [Oleiphilaceae bacterium]
MNKLGLLDAIFVHSESRAAPRHGCGLQIFSPPADAGPEYLRELYDAMRSVPVSEAPCNWKLNQKSLARKLAPAWETLEQIDIDQHFFRWGLPAPGGQKELGELVSHIHSQPLDFSRPLWECHLIEGFDDGRFAILTKGHHAMFDGMRALRWQSCMLSKDPKQRNMVPFWAVGLPEPQTKATPESPQLITDALRAQLTSSFSSLKSLTTATLQALKAATKKDSELTAPYTAPKSPMGDPLTWRRRVATQSVNIERLRAASIDGATINDALLTLIGGAFHRFLPEIDALPEKSLVSAVPMALKSNDASVSGGNALANLLVPIGSHISDPLERMQFVMDASHTAKQHMQQMSTQGMQAWMILTTLPALLDVASKDNMIARRFSNMLISNVPGSKDALYFNGAKMESWYIPSVLVQGSGVNITVSSYNGNLDFAFTSCPDILPHIQKVSVYLQDELELLESRIAEASR